jgi:hypothetical protein
MAHTPLQRFYYFITLLGWKDKVLEKLKHYGVTDFRNLSIEKQEELADEMRIEWNTRSKKPRGAVIHYLCIMPNHNYKIGETPDYDKIDSFIGSKFGGKRLNQLGMKDLVTAVSMVKNWYRKELEPKKKTTNQTTLEL